jgi:AraC-like DNA-binding protein
VFIETHVPTHPLNKLIELIIYFKEYTPKHSLEKVVPDGSSYLLIELDGMPRHTFDTTTHEKKSEFTRAWISGMHTEYITISALPDSEMLAIKFKTYGAFPFFQRPVSEFNNRVIGAEETLGKSVFEFRESLLEAPTYEVKMTLCEKWLLNRFKQDHAPADFILSACDAMQQDPTLEFNSIANLIDEAGVSKKHFLNQFKKYVGLTPKQLQRVFRFNEILPCIIKEDNVSWTQIALNCGYYDQAHFIKEFKSFCGINPSKFITDYKSVERLNFFPLD